MGRACWELIWPSMTTQAPPRSSAPGGRYIITGWRYVRRLSTISDPACHRVGRSCSYSRLMCIQALNISALVVGFVGLNEDVLQAKCFGWRSSASLMVQLRAAMEYSSSASRETGIKLRGPAGRPRRDRAGRRRTRASWRGRPGATPRGQTPPSRALS